MAAQPVAAQPVVTQPVVAQSVAACQFIRSDPRQALQQLASWPDEMARWAEIQDLATKNKKPKQKHICCYSSDFVCFLSFVFVCCFYLFVVSFLVFSLFVLLFVFLRMPGLRVGLLERCEYQYSRIDLQRAIQWGLYSGM